MTVITPNQNWTRMTKDEYGQSCRTYYRRSDGAEVWENTEEYWARPWLAGHRRWSATGPNGRVLGFRHRRTRRYGGKQVPFITTRRWKTPEAAMRAVDRELPLEKKVFEFKPEREKFVEETVNAVARLPD